MAKVPKIVSLQPTSCSRSRRRSSCLEEIVVIFLNQKDTFKERSGVESRLFDKKKSSILICDFELLTSHFQLVQSACAFLRKLSENLY